MQNASTGLNRRAEAGSGGSGGFDAAAHKEELVSSLKVRKRETVRHEVAGVFRPSTGPTGTTGSRKPLPFGGATFAKYWKYRGLFFLLIPGLVALLIFSYYPMYGILIAFKDYRLGKGILASDWASIYGLKHFIDVFTFQGIRRAVWNSFVFSIYQFSVGFPATILFALFLNEIRRSVLKRGIQTISYLPHFLSWVAVAGIVMDVLSPSHGIVNKVLFALTGRTVYFLIEASYFRSIVVFSGLWKGIGWGSIIYLAMIANADQELYDAARADGAGRVRQALHITIPAIYPVMAIGLIFSLSGILSGGDFEAIFNLMNSQTQARGEVLSIYIYRVGLTQFEYSLGAALGLINNIIALALLFVSNKIASLVSEYALW